MDGRGGQVRVATGSLIQDQSGQTEGEERLRQLQVTRPSDARECKSTVPSEEPTRSLGGTWWHSGGWVRPAVRAQSRRCIPRSGLSFPRNWGTGSACRIRRSTGSAVVDSTTSPPAIPGACIAPVVDATWRVAGAAPVGGRPPATLGYASPHKSAPLEKQHRPAGDRLRFRPRRWQPSRWREPPACRLRRGSPRCPRSGCGPGGPPWRAPPAGCRLRRRAAGS